MDGFHRGSPVLKSGCFLKNGVALTAFYNYIFLFTIKGGISRLWGVLAVEDPKYDTVGVKYESCKSRGPRFNDVAMFVTLCFCIFPCILQLKNSNRHYIPILTQSRVKISPLPAAHVRPIAHWSHPPTFRWPGATAKTRSDVFSFPSHKFGPSKGFPTTFASWIVRPKLNASD